MTTTKSQQAGERTHPIPNGSVVEIKNATFSGTIFVEGMATVIRPIKGVSDRYLVRFENGDKVERFATI